MNIADIFFGLIGSQDERDCVFENVFGFKIKFLKKHNTEKLI